MNATEAEDRIGETLSRMATRYGGTCRRYRVTSLGYPVVAFPHVDAALQAAKDLRKIFKPETYEIRLGYLSCPMVEDGRPVRLVRIRLRRSDLEWYIDVDHFASIVNTI